jgi:hypothetical protein
MSDAEAREKGEIMLILGRDVTPLMQELTRQLPDLTAADNQALARGLQRALIAGANGANAELIGGLSDSANKVTVAAAVQQAAEAGAQAAVGRPDITNWELPW